MQEVDTLAQKAPCGAEVGGRLRLENQLHLLGQLVNRVKAESQCHSTLRAHGVDSQWEARDNTIDRGLLEEQRFATARTLHLTVGHFCNLQFAGDWDGDALELPCAFERGYEFAKR